MTKDLEEKLFDKREELVGLAEAYGYGHLFKDKQTIEDMERNIKSIEDEEVRKELLKIFREVEDLYNKYSVEVIEDMGEK